MKALAALALVVALNGCATVGSSSAGAPGGVSTAGESASPVPDSLSPFPAQQPNLGPQLVIPMTGGAPVMGIPVGGNLFIPVTGGAPVPSMPLFP